MPTKTIKRKQTRRKPKKKPKPIEQQVGNQNINLPFVRVFGTERFQGRISRQNFDAMLKEYKSWVYAAVQRNSFALAKAKFKIGTIEEGPDGEEQFNRISQHVFLNLMRNVNPFFNRFELLTLTGTFLELTGNAYWWMPKNALGVPIAIWNIPSNWMRVVPSESRFIAGYVMLVPQKGTPIPFNEDEIVHFKYPSPFDLFYGTGPLLGAASSVDMNNETKSWILNHFTNNAEPGGFLTTENGLSDRQFNRLKDDFNLKHRGTKNAGKLAILEEGLKYQKVGSSMKEAGLDKFNRTVRDEILAIFGVPPSKLGLVEDVNRANAEANDFTYQKETILPRLTLIEEKINEKIMPIYDDALVFKFDNPVPEDKEFRLKEQESHIKSGYSAIDDERRPDGKEPYNKPETVTPLIPFNVIPAGSVTPTPGSNSEPKGAVHKTKAQGGDRWQVFDLLARPQERRFEGIMKRYLDDFQSTVMANLNKQRSMKASVNFESLFSMAEQNEKLARISEPSINEAFTSGFEFGNTTLGNAPDFNLVSPNVTRAIKRRVTFFTEKINKTTSDAIAQAILKGDTIDQTAKNLDKIFGFNDFRAKRIAQTEVIGGLNEGQMESYRASDVKEKVWLTAGDTNVRDSHVETGRQGPIKINDTFSNGLLYPGDRTSRDAPEEVINCRCSLSPVV